MTNDTSIIRVNTLLRDALKAAAQQEGRTLEWMANDALRKYLGYLPEDTTDKLKGINPTIGKADEVYRKVTGETVLADGSRAIVIKKSPVSPKAKTEGFQIKPEALQRAQESRGTCKNGHILGMNGKCLQKGCKYA